MKISDQSSEGKVLFNPAQGRLYSTDLKLSVTIDATTANGPTYQPKIDQDIKIRVTSAGDKKAEESAENSAAKVESKDKGKEEKKGEAKK